MYSLLKGQEMDEAAEKINPAEMVEPSEPKPVVYNGRIPPEFFDFIVIDEGHRSIYTSGVRSWRFRCLSHRPDGYARQPYLRFFKKNIVSEYAHEQAVADGVNVGNEIYVIETEKTKYGGQLKANQHVEMRERLTRRKRWEIQDEDVTYAARQLDRDIVNTDQIRTVIRTFRDKLVGDISRPRRSPEDACFCQGRQPRRRCHPDHARGIRPGQRVLQEDHLQG